MNINHKKSTQHEKNNAELWRINPNECGSE